MTWSVDLLVHEMSVRENLRMRKSTDHDHVDTTDPSVNDDVLDVVRGIDRHRGVGAVLREDGKLGRIGEREGERLGVDDMPGHDSQLPATKTSIVTHQ